MKYSQAVLVTCAASAALVSAIPHGHGIEDTLSVASGATTTPRLGSYLSHSRNREAANDLHKLRLAKVRHAQLKAAETVGDVATPTLGQRSQDLDARSLRDAFHAIKAVRKDNKIKKFQLKSTEAAGKAAAEQASQQQQERDFDEDDLLTRDFDEDLSARMFEQYRQNYREAKAARLQNKAAKATAKAGGGAGDTEVSSGATQTLGQRSQDLDARSLRDMFRAEKAVHKDNKIKKWQMKSTEAAGKAAAEQTSQQQQERDLVGDEDDLLARDFDEDLSARMFEQFRQKYREAKAARLQNKAAKATAKAGGGGAGDTEVGSRDLEEELEMRELNDELSARAFEQFRQKYREAKAIRLQKEAAKATAKAVGGAEG